MPVGAERAADQEAAGGDGFDAEQVAVGQGPPRLPGLDAVVVAGAHDQVADPYRRAARDGHRRGPVDQAEAEQVLPDAARQLPAQGVVGGDQQRVGVVGGQGGVVVGGGLDHQLRVTAVDPGVLVVFVGDGTVAVAEPQAGGALPRRPEPHRLGQPGVAESAGEQGHTPAVVHGLELLGVARDDDLAPVPFGEGDQVGQVRTGHHRRLVDREEGSLADGYMALRAAPARRDDEALRTLCLRAAWRRLRP